MRLHKPSAFPGKPVEKSRPVQNHEVELFSSASRARIPHPMPCARPTDGIYQTEAANSLQDKMGTGGSDEEQTPGCCKPANSDGAAEMDGNRTGAACTLERSNR
eukprot:TRINITY_DN7877_c0_g2_i1.p5 TRINITY_DN7877_c0_g2~~TRINITY_DN7877_c0_g2_i1.p5  ORF type:complete len:104 (-),score=14.18 TRINITY_DN7877_c0_g2_i1:1491-1802(-)